MELGKLNLHDLKKDERLVAVVRRHWFILLKNVLGVAIIFLIPFFVVPLAGVYFTQAGIGSKEIGAVFGLLGSLWALFCWHILFVRWTDFYFDVWIITTWRIVDIDQIGLFRRNTASILDLGHIQDIDIELTGILGNLLNYGMIQVQTAGTKQEFYFEDVANPSKVEKIIRTAQTELSRLHAQETAEGIGFKPHVN